MGETRFAYRAQTNIQLYNQLVESGFDGTDLQRIQRTYLLTADLFAGQIRPEGRPFICHLVGVASILADLGATTPVICAGLLHSAYSQGDFGAGKGRIDNSARKQIEATAGPDACDVIAEYNNTYWILENIENWAKNTDRLSSIQRAVILIRLADTLEDALDFGLQFSAKGEKHVRLIPRDSIVQLAASLNEAALADALSETFAEKGHSEYFDLLREKREGSVVVAPKSYRPKCRTILTWPLSRVVDKISKYLTF